MTDVGQIATAIVDACSALSIRAYDYGPDAPQPPCLYIYPESIDYQVTMDGKDDFGLIIQVLAASMETKGGFQQLCTLISPGVSGSIAQTLIDNPKLTSTALPGGLGDGLVLLPMRNFGTRTAASGATRYWSAEIPVRVYA